MILGMVCLNHNINVFPVAANNKTDDALEVQRDQSSGNAVAEFYKEWRTGSAFGMLAKTAPASLMIKRTV